MKKFFYSLFVLCSLFVSCKSGSGDTDCKIVKVESTDYTEWGSLFEVEKVIPLEQTSSSLLTMASKCLVRDGLIIFADFKLKNLFVFDESGKFKYSCGAVGYSESEHTELYDFSIDKETSTISILDEKGIATYDANNGKFVKRSKLVNKSSAEYSKFMLLGDDGLLLFSADKDFTVYHVDNVGKSVGLRKRSGFQMSNDRFFKSEDNVLVSPDYGKFTIDSYCDDRLQPKYFLDFGSKALPQKLIGNSYDDFVKTDNMKQYFKAVNKVMENKHYLFASVAGPDQHYYTVLYDKRNDKVIAGPNNGDFAVAYVDMDNSGIYGLVYPDILPKGSPLVKGIGKFLPKKFNNPVLVRMVVKG